MDEKALYELGKTVYEIAEIVGLSPTGVWKRLKKQGVSLRQPGTKKGNHWAVTKRGTEFIGSDGRVWVRGVESTNRRNSKRKAVIVMETKLGGPIPKGYFVHHVDGNITNDEPDNLELRSIPEHNRIHHLGKKNPKKGVRYIEDKGS